MTEFFSIQDGAGEWHERLPRRCAPRQDEENRFSTPLLRPSQTPP
jgi:hypothetical protein